MNYCKHCGEQTKNPNYCSRSCAAKENNKTPKRKARQRLCKVCGENVPTGRSKCDLCLLPKDITLGEAIYTKHHKSSAFALVRSRARSAVSSREQVCEVCGYTKHVEVCHVIPISSYTHDTLLSVINAEDNLRLLCPNCHWEHDHPAKGEELPILEW